jgi:hypothetical protein
VDTHVILSAWPCVALASMTSLGRTAAKVPPAQAHPGARDSWTRRVQRLALLVVKDDVAELVRGPPRENLAELPLVVAKLALIT